MSEQRTILTWVDLETTGLRPPADHNILEFAVVFTDLDLNQLASIEGIISQDMQVIKILADDYVIEMHTNSGLLDAIEQARAADEEALNALSYEGELALAETMILHIMKTIGDDDTIFVISGNTIGFDKSYLEEYMPALFDALHYRQLDVSSYKVGFPEIFGTATSDAHRAMPDVRASIEQHRKMRKLIEDAWRYGELSR